MLGGRARTFEYVGMARALQYEVSSTTRGNVSALLVDLYEPIAAGRVVARLDDSEIVAQLNTERAVLNQLAAELEAELLRVGFREAGLIEDRRRFQVDEQRLHLEILSLKVVLESDEIELERRDLQVKRAKPLADDGILSMDEFDDIRLGRDRMARRIEENRTLLEQTENQFLTSRSRRQAYETQFPDLPDKDPVLQPLREAIHAQERRMEEIEIQRRALTLHSPITGRVSRILARGGQSVMPGEPLLFVVGEVASEIIAYAPEAAAGQIIERTNVAAARPENPTLVAESIITRVSPSIEQIPQRMWRDPGTPEYGLPFVIAGVPVLNLKPGEMVEIKILNR